MLRKFAYNKIFRTTGMLLLLLFLLLFPASKEYSLEEGNTIKTGSNIKKQEVYLLDKYGYVARCKVKLSNKEPLQYAYNLIELMILDGKNENIIPNGFKGILPSNLNINDIKIENDTITIDLSEEFNEINKEYESKAIEMLTYNLTTIEGVEKLFIKVNGELLTKLNSSNKNVIQPFTRSDGINKKYDVISYKDTNAVTVYYISKNKEEYYYVPVTKLTNDKREKIKVIIDELTTSRIYETNLMSFLNYNTKLIDYELEEDVLTLNFNEFIFEDEGASKVLEEVIYSISLSIRENYDVKEVNFNVNNKEILKSVIKMLNN